MSMEIRVIHIWDADKFTNYKDAAERGGLRFYDVSHADDYDNLRCGLLYETILAMNTALDAIGAKNRLSFALVINDHIVDYW